MPTNGREFCGGPDALEKQGRKLCSNKKSPSKFAYKFAGNFPKSCQGKKSPQIRSAEPRDHHDAPQALFSFASWQGCSHKCWQKRGAICLPKPSLSAPVPALLPAPPFFLPAPVPALVHCKRRGSEKSTFLAICWGALIFSGATVL